MLLLNLQFFAEEGSTDQPATGTEGEATDAGTAEGADQATPESVEERPSFDELIKGDYKKEFDEKVQGAIAKRFKNQADLQGQLDKMNPILDMVSSRYGIAKTDKGYDIEAIQKKLEEDDSMYEQEAFDRGMDVATLKQIKNLERQNAFLKQQQQEAEQRRGFERLVQQANEAKQIYPDFDLDVEMTNPDFGRLVGVGVDAKTAYQVVHNDELMAAGMQYAVQHTKENISRNIQSGQRPAENGMSNNSPSNLGAQDPSKLTLKEFEDIKQRAMRGERISFA